MTKPVLLHFVKNPKYWNYLHNVPPAKTIFHSGWVVSLVLEIYWIVNSTFMFSSKKRATLLNLFAQINLHDKAWDRKTLKSMFNVIFSTENPNQFPNPNPNQFPNQYIYVRSNHLEKEKRVAFRGEIALTFGLSM